MFGIFKKKPSPLDIFQVNHPIDIPYEQDIIYNKHQSSEDRAKINRMVDIACMAVGLAEIQSVLAGTKRDMNDAKEIGYVFGISDFYKVYVWGEGNFNRSYFHVGLMRYFASQSSQGKEQDILIGVSALKLASMHLMNKNAQFMKYTKIGNADAKEFIDNDSKPLRLHNYLIQRDRTI